jgi:hypothetical protein
MSPSQGVSQAREPRQFHPSLENLHNGCFLVPGLATGNYSIQVATTLDDIEAVRATWKNWAHSLDTDMDYFLHDVAHDPESPSPS